MTTIPHTFHVTSGDIRKGKIGRCQSCPVALAILRDVNQLVWVGISRITIGTRELDGVREFDTPAVVANFIEKFDATGSGDPFSFVLDVSAEFLTGAAI